MRKNGMRLFFYSGGDDDANADLDKELSAQVRKLAGGRRSPRVTYIPSTSWRMEGYFHDFVDCYENYGLTNIDCCPVDGDSINKEQLRRALDGDMIYLSGGNTFYFLKHLREQGVLPELKKFVKRGGVLAGLSAGSIIMTPNIQMAGIPSFDCDPNDVKLRDLRALGLVSFEFFPHYNGRSKVDKELKKYSKTLKRPLYACADGAGIVVDGEQLTLFGKTVVFVRGEKVTLSRRGEVRGAK